MPSPISLLLLGLLVATLATGANGQTTGCCASKTRTSFVHLGNTYPYDIVEYQPDSPLDTCVGTFFEGASCVVDSAKCDVCDDGFGSVQFGPGGLNGFCIETASFVDDGEVSEAVALAYLVEFSLQHELAVTSLVTGFEYVGIGCIGNGVSHPIWITAFFTGFNFFRSGQRINYPCPDCTAGVPGQGTGICSNHGVLDEFSRGNGKGTAKKCVVCHVPNGNPEQANTIAVGCKAVDAHLAEFEQDYDGACCVCDAGFGSTATQCDTPL